MTRSIDIAALKASFRAAAVARGIDPALGATGFQVALHCAEQTAARRRGLTWWRDSALWVDAPPYASTVEEAAIYNVFEEAYLRSLGSDERDADIPPLRERLAATGSQLIWINTGSGDTTSVVCPLDDSRAAQESA